MRSPSDRNETDSRKIASLEVPARKVNATITTRPKAVMNSPVPACIRLKLRLREAKTMVLFGVNCLLLRLFDDGCLEEFLQWII